jgi:serine-type D-Ala-D-Ala endopeptidase (penicillin-binding protein 7)
MARLLRLYLLPVDQLHNLVYSYKMYIWFRTFVIVAILITVTFVGIVAGIHIIILSSPGQPSSVLTKMELSQPDAGVFGSYLSDSFKTVQTYISDNTHSFLTATSSIVLDTQPAVSKNSVTASAYLVGNILTGKVYLSSRPDLVSPVASMSKLMTAIVATNIFDPESVIEITPPETMVASDTSNLQAGERFLFKDIVYPLLLNSSNVAAEAIASSSSSRSYFMDTMSNTAWEVGMPNAYFADPSGLDPRNQASAKDIFKLAQYIYSHRPDIFDITRTPHANMATTTDHGSHNFDSTHPFVTDVRFIGGKTGRTLQAGETMLTVLRIDSQPIAFIVIPNMVHEPLIRVFSSRSLRIWIHKNTGSTCVFMYPKLHHFSSIFTSCARVCILPRYRSILR